MIPTMVLSFVLVLGTAGQRGGSSSANQPPQAPSNQRANPNTLPNANSLPTNQPDNSSSSSANNAPIFLLGSVRLSDGTAAPPSVPVRIICGTNAVRTNAYTDPGGNFSITLNGQRDLSTSDASFARPGTPQNLVGCEVRASLGGYVSTSILLDRHSPLDDPDIGTIYLHPLAEAGDAEGYTVSVTTKLAPKDARKEYEKGLESEKQKKWPEAEQVFLKAVTIYPKYAIAWYELGRVYAEEKKIDDALHAQQQAIQIEPKFVNPYRELANLSSLQQNWADVAQYTAQLIKISPSAGPQVYFSNAGANFNMHQLDAAEKSARAAANLDDKHKMPRINYLLGLILKEKKDYKGAIDNLRIYLQSGPADAAAVQQQVAELEKASGQ